MFSKKTEMSDYQKFRIYEKVRLYFQTHPDKDRKKIGLFILEHLLKWEEGTFSVKELIDTDWFSNVSAKTFVLTEAELRALLPKELRPGPMNFLNALKRIYESQGMS